MAVAVARWVGPFLLSAIATAFIGWGSVQYAKGSNAQRLSTVERDVSTVEREVKEAKGEHEKFVTREEFGLIREDLKEIKLDVREVRRSLTK